MADTQVQATHNQPLVASKQQKHPTQDPQQQQHPTQDPQQKQRLYQVVKAATAATAGGSLLVLSSLTLVATVVALTLATPLLVIFSPVLVPAAVTVFLISTGFLASGSFGVASVGVLAWIYRYVTGKNPSGSDQIDAARQKITGTAKDLKDWAEQYGHEAATTHAGAGAGGTRTTH